MMFCVYGLYNQLRKKIYIGQTEDLPSRLKRHNGELLTKKSSFTSLNSGRWELVYTEKYQTRKEGLEREKQLKTQKGREFIWNIVKNKYK